MLQCRALRRCWIGQRWVGGRERGRGGRGSPAAAPQVCVAAFPVEGKEYGGRPVVNERARVPLGSDSRF